MLICDEEISSADGQIYNVYKILKKKILNFNVTNIHKKMILNLNLDTK